ncbi:MAG: chloride channel protein [Bacteroidetes bacterium]|nr:chloride channel protein [Bacteroidota bacterium]MBU1117238.1 chloride channel protein [Bacteroidota bacterium]MBU1800302.1 chloride channel protein [Bacteroidota bacterium]
MFEDKFKIWQRGKVVRKFFSSFRYSVQNFFAKNEYPEYTIFSILAIITGASVGLAAVLFHKLIQFFEYFFFDLILNEILFIGIGVVIVIPIIGMLLQSLMIYLFPKTAKRKGVIDVIKAVSTRGGYIPFRTTLFHALAPVISIGSGGTVGPEGPAAQIGGGVASKLGQLFDLSDQRKRMFTAAGAGAAISAVFNTPLGGIFFALEVVLLNDFHTATFSALILASVTASVISRIFLGNTPAFQFTDAGVGPYENFYLFLILGILAGILSLLFIRYSSVIRDLFHKHLKAKYPQWALMSVVGLLVGVSGFFHPEIFGIGYETINKLLNGQTAWQLALILLVLKFILVPLILSSGGFGGIFAPSLFMGASFGYLFAVVLQVFFGIDVNVTTYVLVGMGAMLGGINSIPISAILIIFEMTKDYAFILPLMLAVVMSSMIVQWKLKGTITAKHLEEEGFEISSGRDTAILKSLTVSEAMKRDIFMVKANLPVPSLISQLVENPHNVVYTTDNNDKIIGVITDNEIMPIITEYDTLSKMLVANDIARSEVTIVSESDNLDFVFKIMGKGSMHQFPVKSDDGQISGIIRRQDVISAYNKATMKMNVKDSFATELRTLNQSKGSKVADGYSIIEHTIPRAFIGKSVIDLKFRNTYGLEILMVKHKRSVLSEETNERVTIPSTDYKFTSDDLLVLFGSDEKIEEFKEKYY